MHYRTSSLDYLKTLLVNIVAPEKFQYYFNNFSHIRVFIFCYKLAIAAVSESLRVKHVPVQDLLGASFRGVSRKFLSVG